MPIPIQNSEVIVPDSVYIPQIVIQCGIVNGKLKTSATITLSAAKCENSGLENEFWTSTEKHRTLYISDIENLEEDLASLQTSILPVFGGIITLIAGMNAIRRII